MERKEEGREGKGEGGGGRGRRRGRGGRGRRRGGRGSGREERRKGGREGSPNYWGFGLICQSIIPQQLVTREIEHMCVGWK